MEKLFHNIMHQPVYFPSFLSEQGKSVLEGLLCRDPVQRLGCGKDDGEEVMRHPFFAGIDFEKLLNRTYQPPFKPKVVSHLKPRTAATQNKKQIKWLLLMTTGGLDGRAQL